MAFRASLELNNKEFDVLYSNYEFSRDQRKNLRDFHFMHII